MNLKWSWHDWSLERVTSRWPNGNVKEAVGIFALRCNLCGRFTLGCLHHLFCGLCETCRQDCEAKYDEDAYEAEP